MSERGELKTFSWVRPFIPPPTGRHCTRCKQWLPFGAFRPNLRLKSGWNSWCKACSAESTRRWRERNADKLRRPRVAPSQKTCVECGSQFAGRKDRLLCGARRCKDRRYRRLHPDTVRAKQRRKDERRRERVPLPEMVYRYNIEVELARGADLSFVVFRDRALLPNETVRDFGRDRSYVIVSVAETTSHDPLDPSILHGSAIARPTD